MELLRHLSAKTSAKLWKGSLGINGYYSIHKGEESKAIEAVGVIYLPPIL